MFLNDWEESEMFGLIADFAGIYISKEEYEATKSPYANSEYWAENKQKMKEALKDPQWKGVKVLLASYGRANYSGGAFVLFKKDGKLFEVNAGHCSCHGLEGQWEPSETTIESLEHRLEKGTLGDENYCDNVFGDELRAVLKKLKRKK